MSAFEYIPSRNGTEMLKEKETKIYAYFHTGHVSFFGCNFEVAVDNAMFQLVLFDFMAEYGYSRDSQQDSSTGSESTQQVAGNG